MRWDPRQYARFAGPRLQPGLDLIARIPPVDAGLVVDLGCGGGELTELLAERFDAADVVGVDSSEEMLAKARHASRRARFEQGDIATWRAARPVDVLFSNAAYHWLDDHPALFPRLISQLAPGGVFAAQMPRNFDAPSHTALREVAHLEPFRGRIALREEPVLSMERYYDVLRPLCAELDVWETEYLHALEGAEPVYEWTRGTAMLPVMAALRGPELEAFADAYKARLRAAYPRQEDGVTLFRFKRLFLLGRAR